VISRYSRRVRRGVTAPYGAHQIIPGNVKKRLVQPRVRSTSTILGNPSGIFSPSLVTTTPGGTSNPAAVNSAKVAALLPIRSGPAPAASASVTTAEAPTTTPLHSTPSIHSIATYRKTTIRLPWVTTLGVALLPMRAQALKGHLDALLLAVLDGGPRHGYAVIEALREGSDGHFDLPTGTVYPALRRLEATGLVRSGWSVVAGRRRRTYQLTDAGRRTLAEQRTAWHQFAGAVSNLLQEKPWPATP
jgi:PadR family transcriptional regulator PadR